MSVKKTLELPVIRPLFYGTRPANSKIFISPSSYAVGAFFIAPEKEKYLMINSWLEYNRQRQEDCAGFPGLLSYNPRELGELIKDRIRKEKGTKKLWKVNDVITEGKLKHNVLTARVESRRSGRGKKVLKKWLVTVKTPFYNNESGVDYSDISCQDDMHQIVKGKGAEFFCAHMGALVQKAHDEYLLLPEEERSIDFEDPQGIPYLPYWLDSKRIIDVIVKHYLLRRKYYEIERELLDDPDVYNPSYLEAIRNGNVVFENIPLSQRKKKRPTKNFTKGDEQALWYIKNTTEKDLINGGFRRTGISALELKGTRFEALCPTFEKDNRVARLSIANSKTPLLIFRERSDADEVDIFYKNDPLTRLYDEQFIVDDSTRTRTRTRIVIPHSPKSIPELPELTPRPIIENFKPSYASLIERNYRVKKRGEKKQLLRELGL